MTPRRGRLVGSVMALDLTGVSSVTDGAVSVTVALWRGRLLVVVAEGPGHAQQEGEEDEGHEAVGQGRHRQSLVPALLRKERDDHRHGGQPTVHRLLGREHLEDTSGPLDEHDRSAISVHRFCPQACARWAFAQVEAVDGSVRSLVAVEEPSTCPDSLAPQRFPD